MSATSGGQIEGLQEREQGGVDLVGLLLLHPVAGFFDHGGAAVVVEPAVHDRGGAHQVDRVVDAGEEGGRHRDVAAVELGRGVPEIGSSSGRYGGCQYM